MFVILALPAIYVGIVANLPIMVAMGMPGFSGKVVPAAGRLRATVDRQQFWRELDAFSDRHALEYRKDLLVTNPGPRVREDYRRRQDGIFLAAKYRDGTAMISVWSLDDHLSSAQQIVAELGKELSDITFEAVFDPDDRQ